MDSTQDIIVIIFVLAVFVTLFYFLSEVVLWYYKVNERISKQETIIKILRDINYKLEQIEH